MLDRIKSFFKPIAPAPTQPAVNHDGAINVLNGLGIRGRDSSASTFFQQDSLLQREQCEAYYTSSGIGRRVVELIVNDALGKGIDCDHALYKEMERIDGFNKITELATVARLYGGAIMVLLAKDGSDTLEAPLNEGSLEQVDKLVIFDRWQCSDMSTDYDDDVTSPTYGEKVIYNITPYNGQPLKVHYTRVIRIDGDYIPHHTRRLNQGWGASALQAVQAGFKSYSTMQGFLPMMASEFSLTFIRIMGLADAYVAGKEGTIAKRVNDLNLTKGTTNIVLLDGESEEFKREFASVGGYADMITKGMELLSAEAGIPMTLLFGRSPEGMNATGESDLDNWYKNVQRYQANTLQSPINRLVELFGMQTGWTEKPDSLDWNWPSLQPLDDLELADVRLKNAQADNIYIQAGAVDPEYIFHMRHDGSYNVQLNYSEEGMKEHLANAERPLLEVRELNEGDI